MPNDAVLRTVTTIAAEKLGIAAETGSIEPGKTADLLVLDADPLKNIRATARIHSVVRAGAMFDGFTLDLVHEQKRRLSRPVWQPAAAWSKCEAGGREAELVDASHR